MILVEKLFTGVTWLIDVAGKIGPLAIAWLVFDNTRQHSEWQRKTGLHASQVEAQKARLALLDRRMAARQKLIDAMDEYSVYGTVSDDMISKTYEAISVIEMTFSAEAESLVRELGTWLFKWKSVELKIGRLRANPAAADLLEKAIDEQDGIEDEMIATFAVAIADLKDAIRISDIDPLQDSERAPSVWPSFNRGLMGLVRLERR